MRTFIILFFLINTSLFSIAQKSQPNFSQSIANGFLKMDKTYFFYKDIKNNILKEEIIYVKNFSKEDI